MSTTQPSASCKVQGSSLQFVLKNLRSPCLSVKIMKDRSQTLESCHGSFIENTNFHKLPPNCCGVLIAFRVKLKHELETSQWSLGIVIHLHPQETVIAPCFRNTSCYSDESDKYTLSEKLHTYKPYSIKNDNLQIVYLNCLDNTACIGNDGYIESSTNGPDVPYKYTTFPSDIFRMAHDLVSSRVTSLFSLTTPKCYRNLRRSPFSSIESLNIKCKQRINLNNVNTIRATEGISFATKSRRKVEGYAFPYINKDVTGNLNKLRFAFLDHDNAKYVIGLKVLNSKKYNTILDTFAMRKEEMQIKYTGENGLAIERTFAGETNETNSDAEARRHDEAYSRKGLLHGLWVPCDTFTCEDHDLLEYTLRKTYGNFGFTRSKTPCFGLNAYTGKKSAEYVRPSPRMSKASTTRSEYYRSSFDSTFHPLIYKLINQLSSQASQFQKNGDPVYDRFLYEAFVKYEDLTRQESKKDGDCLESCKKRKRDETQSKPRNKNKKRLYHRRFAALSILTCGNKVLRGFANIGHKDNDFLDKQFHTCSLKILKAMRYEIKQKGNAHLKRAFDHIRRKYHFQNKFSTMTTCGYRIFSRHVTNKIVHAYFMYSSIGIAVSIPTEKSCYHTFDGTMGIHQTTVPVTFCPQDDLVRFDDNDIFIFAWGNGKSARRLWLEDQNHIIPAGRRVNANDIRDFFNNATQAQQDHINRNGWL